MSVEIEIGRIWILDSIGGFHKNKMPIFGFYILLADFIKTKLKMLVTIF